VNNDLDESLVEKTTALINKIKEITNQQDKTNNLLSSAVDDKIESRLVLTEQLFLYPAVLTYYIYLQNSVTNLNKRVLSILQIQHKSSLNVKQSRIARKKSRVA